MSLRRVPPVYSPIRLRGLLRGLAESIGADTGARAAVDEWIRSQFAAQSALLTDSGTSALSLALRLAGGSGPVALPAYACYDLATAADGADVRVLLYDIDPATLQPDWSSVRNALAQGARALVVVHLYGIPVDLGRAAHLTVETGAWLIEDAAQGAGGSWREKALGSFGDFAVLSFGRGKGVTGGAGGALLAHSVRAREGFARMPALASGGRGAGALVKATAQMLLGRPSLYALPSALPFLRLGETVYHPATAPTGMPRGALGLLADALGIIDEEGTTRRANGARLGAALGTDPRFGVVRIADGATPGYLRFPLVPSEALRDQLPMERMATLGVAPGYPLSLADLPGFEGRVVNRDTPFPGARALAARLVTGPTHSRQRPADLESCIGLFMGAQPG